jgi:transposase-like protein
MKARIVDMAINGSGIRNTARVLKVNLNTVIATLKKSLQPLRGQPELSR